MKTPKQLLALLTIALTLTACGRSQLSAADAAVVAASAAVTTLVRTDTQIGTGAEAIEGKQVMVHYTGWLFDPKAEKSHGKKFDSSVDRSQPFVFTLGAGQVIKGWDAGVAGMKVGGKRTLTIPGNMAYGGQGAGNDIPPDAALVFDVELLGVN